MDLGEIIGDALRYPLSNWKNFLILGIIFVVGGLYNNFLSLGNNTALIVLLGFVGFIFGIVAYGYEIRILKSSLAGFGELPKFNAMFDMFIDGLKVLIVYSFFNPFDFDFSFWDIILRICFSNNGNEFFA